MIAQAEGKLILLRHSMTEANGQASIKGGRSDVDLSRAGEVAAANNAARLAERPIVAIWSSPKIRTQRTAEPIAEKLGLEVRTSPLLVERDFGTFENTNLSDAESLEARFRSRRNWRRAPNDRLIAQLNPEYETDRDLLVRAVVFVNSLEPTKPDEETLIVGHWDWTSNLLLHATGRYYDPGNNGFAVINREDFSVEELVDFELRRTHR